MSDSAILMSTLKYVQPFVCMLHNIPSTLDTNRKGVVPDLDWLIPLLNTNGLILAKKSVPAVSEARGFIGCVIIKFDGEDQRECSRQARTLQKAFAEENASKVGYHMHRIRMGPYLWIASEHDHVDMQIYEEGSYTFNRVPLTWEHGSLPTLGSLADHIYKKIWNHLRTGNPTY